MQRVRELPLVPSSLILDARHPAAPAASRAPLRTMKEHGWLSDGVEFPVRSIESGHMAGRVHLYCSLNLDAARFGRLGLDDLARAYAKGARLVEKSQQCREVVANLRTMSLESGVDEMPAYIKALTLGAVRRSVLRLIDRVDLERVKLPPAPSSVRTIEATVDALGEEDGWLAAEDGRRIPVKRSVLRRLGVDYLGAPVLMHVEAMGMGQTLTLEPGVPVEPERPSAEDWHELAGDSFEDSAFGRRPRRQ